MNRNLIISIGAALVLSMSAAAQTYYDAAQLPLYGKACENTLTRYERLPASYEDISRPPLWKLGRNSAGLAIRFRSDSPYIRAKWTAMFGNAMNHMTLTGIRGLDLYALSDGEWRFAGSARPGDGKENDVLIVGNMTREMREYILYLSLYDGVLDLEIGVEEGSVLEQPAMDYPSREKPLVFYGTSIMQGGCVSRPGMLATSMISRKLGRETINLGFSGNAQLDLEIAELMASVPDPSVFILDYVPNSSEDLIRKNGEKFFRIIRDAHPDVPCIFVEDPEFTHAWVNTSMRAEINARNEAQKELYELLKSQGEKGLYYVPGHLLLGYDGEATVDGIHSTDLGAVRYVDALLPVIEKALKTKAKGQKR